MGSIIYLRLGKLELDWSKNSISMNHSVLFAPTDVHSADYFYAGDTVEQKPAFVRPLHKIVRRLDLLGFTTAECEQRYNALINTTPSYYDRPSLSFEQFAQIMTQVDVEAVALHEGAASDYDLGELAGAIFKDSAFANIHPSLATLTREASTFFENLHPYVNLRLLAENPRNATKEVIWSFADLVDGGWVQQEQLYEGLSPSDRWLVVTEGSTDGSVLAESLPVVAPDVADFFQFVDMSENYPFTGTGNVFRFCQGLARIGIQNRVLVVLDNDTAGHSTASRIAKLALPPQMRVTVLPDLEAFRAVRTLGPSGEQREDINGRAVSIECFLDMEARAAEPTARWTSYDDQTNKYQGELIGKVDYVRHFMKNIKRTKNWPSLLLLWNHLLTTCTAPAANRSVQRTGFNAR